MKFHPVKLHNWSIEYEIPPLRAIYTGYAVATSVDAARDIFTKEGPELACIRKIRRIEPPIIP